MRGRIIVAEGIGRWMDSAVIVVKLLIWVSRVTLVLKDIKQSTQPAGLLMPAMAAYIAVPDCQELDTHAMLTSKAADT